MSDKEHNPTGENAPASTSPETRRARISQLEDEHNGLNAEWNELQHQIQVTMPVAGKDPDAIDRDQSRLEEFFERADQIHQRHSAIEDELFRLWHHDNT